MLAGSRNDNARACTNCCNAWLPFAVAILGARGVFDCHDARLVNPQWYVAVARAPALLPVGALLIGLALGDGAPVLASPARSALPPDHEHLEDRAGEGWSDIGPRPRDATRVATELHTLLANAGVEGPFVLVGHSFGGLYTRVSP
jgi:pimeloyl-ACP methyl ester carboxylesterase